MKKIIIAPLNWGLGHATRCVPIIKELLKTNFLPIIASDGDALLFLRSEFPTLDFIVLPSYNISYGKNLKWNLFKKIPKILKAVKQENRIISQYLNANADVIGIISDNRFGVHSNKVPSVYITHQINVFSGFFTSLTSYFHQLVIKKYQECWIPDEENSLVSGKLSLTSKNLNQKYIGVLSRFKKQDIPKTIDILIILSGPEPNRSYLENKLLTSFNKSSKQICLIQGKIEETQKITYINTIKIVNFMLSDELEKTINSSDKIICRAGYSSILDLISLEKKAILIPTKNQTEQEYLAEYLEKNKYFSFIKEDEIDETILELNPLQKGKNILKNQLDSSLFGLFQSK